MRKRSPEALAAAQDFLLFRKYVCGHDTYEHMMVWHKELNTGNDNKYLRGIAGEDVCILSPRNSSKSQPLWEQVLTPNGWMCMGDIKVGDYVISVDGMPTKVIAVHPQGVKDTYRVTFTDGSSAHCSDDHLWYVRNLGGSNPKEYKVTSLNHIRTKKFIRTTGNYKVGSIPLYETVDENEKPWLDYRDGGKYHIPVCDPVQFEKKYLPVDPYILGVLIGDGCISHKQKGCTLSTIDQEIIDNVQTRLPDGYLVKRKGTSNNFSICPGIGRGNKGIDLLVLGLEDLGLYGKKSYEKSIPEVYLQSSIEDRLLLLQGLMDTDGTVSRTRNGGLSYTTTSLTLAKDLIALVQSLGGIATMRTPSNPTYSYNGEKRTGRLAYCIGVKLPPQLPPFKLTRKLEIYRPCTKSLSRSIRDIEHYGSDEHQCISVEHPSQLYITRNCIVTHNSTFLLQWVAYIIGTHVMQGISLKILYISYAVDAAIGKSRQIKSIIESDIYQEVFPLIKKSKSKWGESEWAIDFNFANLRSIDESYTLVCAGLKGSINSRRAHVAVIDDPQKDIDEAKSKSIQDRMESNYNNVLKYTRYDGSRFITLGTRMAKHDAYSRIFVPPYYKVITQKALVTEMLPNGKTFERSFWEPTDDDSPGLRLGTLLKERTEDYESFLLQRQNELPASTSVGINPDWIKYSWIPKKFDRIVIGADTADSTEENANSTAFVIIGIANDSLYVIDAWEGKIAGNLKKVDKIYDLWLKRKGDCKQPAIIAVDQHRWSKGLSGDFQSYIEDIDLDETIDAGFASVSIERISSSGRGEKIDRVMAHSYLFEKGRVYFNLISPKDDAGTELIPKIVTQITDYNPIDHNDLMDALECAVYAARQYITGEISTAG